MIIVCSDEALVFYNANTLLPIEEGKAQQLDGYVMGIAYHEETEAFLLGCSSGSIYVYNACNDELRMLRKLPKDREERVMAVEFLSSSF